MSSPSEKTVVLVHGAWVTTRSWDTFRRPFERAGYRVLTPTWPGLEGLSAAQVRRHLPVGFGSLSLGRIVDHLEAYIQALPQPPLLVGHSFGGLLVQKLLDRGCGAAGVAINPAPIAGIVPGPTTLAAVLPALARWRGWSRPYAHTRGSFGRQYANTAPHDLVSRFFNEAVIPTPGRILHQAATWLGTGIDPRRRTQPLLITGSEADRLVTPHLSRAAYAIQRRAPGLTDFSFYDGLSHLLIAEPGYERVARDVIGWLEALPTFAGRPLRASDACPGPGPAADRRVRV
ncbi:alpha/beta hydrolase [Phenylobacterium deserti]|uniref:Alpha/beta hydrolase n=1 Tax=Phenylobacterium deserti TaxID=1914756 RepID=A0A328AD17_9CAUL|nr:alpha/beta fold hydrolase [Phenylobacterium deserti]RAK52713.1 alpha/beta hydrolase [Phenylobacterium deserti]